MINKVIKPVYNEMKVITICRLSLCLPLECLPGDEVGTANVAISLKVQLFH